MNHRQSHPKLIESLIRTGWGEPVVGSRNGLVLMYSADKDLIQDEITGYADDLIDCFQTWDEKGSLKQYVKECLLREMSMVREASRAGLRPTKLEADMLTASMRVLERKINVLSSEEEDKLRMLRDEYLREPAATIIKMVRAVRENSEGRREFIRVSVGSAT